MSSPDRGDSASQQSFKGYKRDSRFLPCELFDFIMILLAHKNLEALSFGNCKCKVQAGAAIIDTLNILKIVRLDKLEI